MVNPNFPTLVGLGWSVKRTVQWDTVQHDAISGKRIRFSNWTFPLRHFELTLNVLRTYLPYVEWQTFEGFFNQLLGSFGIFYYDDPNDDSITNQPFGEGDGATTSFQLVRTLGGFTEPVFIVNPNIVPVITVAGTPTTAFTISAYGVVTFATAPPIGNALVWTGSYYWPVQFDDDQMNFDNFVSQMMKAQSVKFTTMKLP